MTYKDKLIELLKSDEEVKSSMEKLEFGTRIILKDYIDEKTINQLIDYNCMEFKVCVLGDKIFTQKDIEKIIGLPLQERFIRMYLNNKNIYNIITGTGHIMKVSKDISLISTGNVIVSPTYIKINNNLDFDNQSDKVYKQIFLALKEMIDE